MYQIEHVAVMLSEMLLRVQRAGRGAQDADAFLRGFPLPPGTKLG